MKFKIRLFATLLAGLCLAVSAAKANAVYSLGVGNSSLSPTYPGPYGSVDVNLTTSTTAIITFTGNTVGGFTYKFGAAQAIDVNVNAASFTVSNLSSSDLSFAGTGNVSTFGSFNATFDNFDG